MCDVCHRLQATMTDGTTTTNDLLSVWTVKVIINPGTSIAQVQLPFWTRGSSMQGAKQARDSIIKLLTGMNNDVNPLNFRSEKKLDGTIDVYYKFAPGWTTLSGGWRPTISVSPTKIVGMLIDACQAVPFVKEVTIHIMENDTTREVGLEELTALNIPCKAVPMLNGGGASTSTSSTSDARVAQELRDAREEAARCAAEAQALRDQVDLQAKHADDMRASLEQLRAEIKELSLPTQAAIIDKY